MKIRENWRDLLTAALGDQDWAPISRRAKLNPTYLRDILKKGQTPQLKSAEKLSDALAVPITDWFLVSEPASPSPSHAAPAETPTLQVGAMPRDFPVFGSAQCGADGEFEFNTGDVIDYVRRPPRLTGIKDAYALYVCGDSMKPWRKHGQLVYVHAGQPPTIGDHVVVQIKAAKQGEAPRAFIKLFEKRTASELVLEQYNPPLQRKYPLSKVVTVHRILDWDELLGI